MKDNILENEINITEIIKEVEIQKKENIIDKYLNTKKKKIVAGCLVGVLVIGVAGARRQWRCNARGRIDKKRTEI